MADSTPARLTQTPPNVKLLPADQIADGHARGLVLDIRGQHFHGFIVRSGQQIKAYVDSCPHTGAVLAARLDDYLTPKADFISCAWHGALFRIEDGVCVAGPCRGQSLREWPIEVRDGWVYTT